MSSPDPQVRAARNHSTNPAARRPVVAVTGAASGVGALLTERLAASEEIKQVKFELSIQSMKFKYEPYKPA